MVFEVFQGVERRCSSVVHDIQHCEEDIVRNIKDVCSSVVKNVEHAGDVVSHDMKHNEVVHDTGEKRHSVLVENVHCADGALENSVVHINIHADEVVESSEPIRIPIPETMTLPRNYKEARTELSYSQIPKELLKGPKFKKGSFERILKISQILIQQIELESVFLSIDAITKLVRSSGEGISADNSKSSTHRWAQQKRLSSIIYIWQLITFVSLSFGVSIIRRFRPSLIVNSRKPRLSLSLLCLILRTGRFPSTISLPAARKAVNDTKYHLVYVCTRFKAVIVLQKNVRRFLVQQKFKVYKPTPVSLLEYKKLSGFTMTPEMFESISQSAIRNISLKKRKQRIKKKKANFSGLQLTGNMNKCARSIKSKTTQMRVRQSRITARHVHAKKIADRELSFSIANGGDAGLMALQPRRPFGSYGRPIFRSHHYSLEGGTCGATHAAKKLLRQIHRDKKERRYQSHCKASELQQDSARRERKRDIWIRKIKETTNLISSPVCRRALRYESMLAKNSVIRKNNRTEFGTSYRNKNNGQESIRKGSQRYRPKIRHGHPSLGSLKKQDMKNFFKDKFDDSFIVEGFDSCEDINVLSLLSQSNEDTVKNTQDFHTFKPKANVWLPLI